VPKNKKPVPQRDASGNHHDVPRKPASSAHIRPVSAVALEHIRPHPHNARTHSRKQIRQIAASIQAVGFASPVLIDEHGTLLAGHGRLEAAKLLAFKTIPAIVVDGLTEPRKRALLLADNRIAQNAGWNRERLAEEFLSLPELLLEDGLDITVTGFEPAEIDAVLTDFEDDGSDPLDDLDPALLSGPAVTRTGDLWQLGPHRLLCGDAREPNDLSRRWVATVPIWPFSIPLIMCGYGTSGAAAKSSIVNSRWRQARCPKPHSRIFSPTRSRVRAAFRSMVRCTLCVWIGATLANSLLPAPQFTARCSI
jgi:hypothetical protein